MFQINKNSDVLLALGLILMLGLMLIPLPPMFLDMFLALNISLAVLVLILSLYIKSPLDFSVFPGLLLILTLFRLSLNISSTRLILIDAYAGQVIESFGSFVVSGDYIVGFIVFLILVIIQFIVIVKGSGRISEVSARFTLDAMPGKQMAIDADLNSGLVTESEARQRRENISREAEFFGAMDGASKFVKGDAIAGILINVINIIAGFVIGVAQKGMDFTDALQTYTMLTIGDGLVSQIPALVIATSAGMVVTRSASGTSLDSQMKTQLLSNPRVLGTVSGVIMLLAFVPGMPMLPFMLISIGAGMGSFFTKKNITKKQVDTLEKDESTEEVEKEDNVEQYLQVDPIELEIGYGLISLVDENEGGNLFEKISSTRKFIALEFGLLIPPVRVRDNLQLEPNEYVIKIKGNVVASYEIHPDRWLAMNSGLIEEAPDGIPTNDPAFKLPAVWVNKEGKEKSEILGYTVVDAISVLTTHLQETLKNNFDKVLTRQSVKQLLENLKKDYSAVVEDINPEVLPLGSIQKVLQNLLREFIPIKDLVQILEALIDYSKVTKNIDVLTEYARHAVGDIIANLYKDQKNTIHAAALGDSLEQHIISSIKEQKDAIQTLGLNPALLNHLKNNMVILIDKFNNLGFTPVIITSATIRPYFYRLFASSFPEIAVISYSELPSQVELEIIDKLEVTNEN